MAIHPASDAQHGKKSYPGERGTRLSTTWTAIAVGIIALAVVLIFILQNPQSVDLSFLVFHGRPPLGVALLFAMILGAALVLAVGGARILQLRLVARQARRRSTASGTAVDLAESPPQPGSVAKPGI